MKDFNYKKMVQFSFILEQSSKQIEMSNSQPVHFMCVCWNLGLSVLSHQGIFVATTQCSKPLSLILLL